MIKLQEHIYLLNPSDFIQNCIYIPDNLNISISKSSYPDYITISSINNQNYNKYNATYKKEDNQLLYVNQNDNSILLQFVNNIWNLDNSFYTENLFFQPLYNQDNSFSFNINQDNSIYQGVLIQPTNLIDNQWIYQTDYNHIYKLYVYNSNQGVKGNNGFSYNENSLILFKEIFQTKSNLYNKNKEIRIQNENQSIEISNFSEKDKTIINLNTQNHTSYDYNNGNELYYESFIAENDFPVFKITIKNEIFPIKIQILLLDENNFTIKRITMDTRIENEENSSSSSEENSSSIEEESSSSSENNDIYEFEYIGDIELLNLLKSRGIVNNNYRNLKWKCRYCTTKIINEIREIEIWREWGETIDFTINKRPSTPKDLNIIL